MVGLRTRIGLGGLVSSVAALACSVLLSGAPAAAHDEIESSIPADRSVIDEPISTASIDFGEVISDDVSLFLTYDPGDGSTVDIGGTTVKTGDTTARLDFPELTVEGTYFLRFLAPVPSDGHVIIGAISFTWGAPTAIDDGDNPDIRSSTPRSRERIDDPISSATIVFDVDIADDVVLALVFDRGDGENFDELGGVTTKTGSNSATLDFPEIERKGTYFVRYDAASAESGDELVGATSFTFGQPSSSDSDFPVLPFAAVAISILAVGAWFTMRGMKAAEEPDDSELTPA